MPGWMPEWMIRTLKKKIRNKTHRDRKNYGNYSVFCFFFRYNWRGICFFILIKLDEDSLKFFVIDICFFFFNMLLLLELFILALWLIVIAAA